MSSDDLVRYITEQMMKHYKQPKTERKQRRAQKKTARPPFANRWFGLLPYAVAFFLRRFRRS
ncbi:MAG TPA: YqzE family protein [Bacillales bacterium]|nr:YqzE family protein [Bacillales bacterium]